MVRTIIISRFLIRYQPYKNEDHIHMEETIHAIRWSDKKLESLRKEMASDPVLSCLKNVVSNGWPSKCSDVSSIIKPYRSMKDYIGLEDGLLLKGRQIIIPATLQNDVLSQIHNHCHQGVEKTQLLSRKFKKSQKRQPMYERDIPSAPWEMIGIDLFAFAGHKYLLLCDYFSKFFIVRKLANETSYSVIKHLKQIFTEQGIPVTLFSDNGPCYSSNEFKQFVKSYGINHITSSPHYP